MKYDIAIIGAGVAGVFASLRLTANHPNLKVAMLDIGMPPMKRRRQIEGYLGCFPTGDGKLYENDKEEVLKIIDGRRVRSALTWVNTYLKQVHSMKLIKTPKLQAAAIKKLEAENYQYKYLNYSQWKPESIHALSRLISEETENAKNMEYFFNTEVLDIKHARKQFIISTSDGEIVSKKVILCTGRSGWRWTTKLYKDLGLKLEDDTSTFGIRAEISASNMKEYNKSHCLIYRDDLEIGPLSWGGTIIPEDHADLVISSFRSNEDRWRSTKVSFNIFSHIENTGEGCYQTDRIGKLAFLLFNDRVSRERIRIFLKNNSQLCLLPEYNWLHEKLEEINKIMPNLLTKGYLHVPAIAPRVGKIKIKSNLETDIDNLFVAGENAGVSGILAAAIMGTVSAESAAK